MRAIAYGLWASRDGDGDGLYFSFVRHRGFGREIHRGRIENRLFDEDVLGGFLVSKWALAIEHLVKNNTARPNIHLQMMEMGDSTSCGDGDGDGNVDIATNLGANRGRSVSIIKAFGRKIPVSVDKFNSYGNRFVMVMARVLRSISR